MCSNSELFGVLSTTCGGSICVELCPWRVWFFAFFVYEYLLGMRRREGNGGGSREEDGVRT